MNDPLKQRFQDEGTRELVSGNTPILLDDPAAVWLVRAGAVEIFSVHWADGQVAGARHHFFTVSEGDLFTGMEVGLETAGRAFLAVGMVNTRLDRVPLERLQEWACDEQLRPSAARLIDTWVANLSRAVASDINLRADHQLVSKETITIRGATSCRAKDGILWLRQLRGRLLFIGLEEIDLGGQQSCFPLSPDSRVEAMESAELSCVSTESLLAADPGALWSGLAFFHSTVLQCEAVNRPLADADESNRIRSRIKWEADASENALRSLARALDKPGRIRWSDRALTDPLIGACHLVCDAQAIDLKVPKELIGGSRVRDPLAMIARASRFRVRTVTLRGDWWSESCGPLLGFIADTGAPVALLPVSPREYEMRDSTTGAAERITRDNVDTLANVACAFYAPFPATPIRNRDLIPFALKGHWIENWRLLVIATLIGFLGLAVPWATGVVFDVIIPTADSAQLIAMVLALVFIVLGRSCLSFCRNLLLVRLEGKFDSRLQSAFFDRLLDLPAEFFMGYSAGDLASRAGTIGQIRQILSGGLMSSLIGGMFSLFSLLLMMHYHFRLGLVVLLLAALAMVVSFLLSYARLQTERKMWAQAGKTQGLVFQLLTGIAKLRTAGAETHAFAAWSNSFSRQKQLDYQWMRYQHLVTIFLAIYPFFCSAVIFYLLFHLSDNDPASPLGAGRFLGFMAAFAVFINGVIGIAEAFVQLFKIGPLLERARPILATPPEVVEAKEEAPELSGSIEISQVSFRYRPQDPFVLHDITFKIRAGEFAAIVGPSGSGKSTLMRLLLGFNHPETGSIHFDGQDLATLDIRSVRQQIGVVLQNGKLLDGDILGNIIGGLPLTEEDAWEAAKMSGLELDIHSMPLGMRTPVNPNSTALSGGQIQRLLIARALANRPSIFLLDEATSALDNQTQRIVTESLDRVQATRIVIAHRLSTIENADRILVLDDGRIVQSGSYEELLNQSGLFADMAKRQLVEVEAVM